MTTVGHSLFGATLGVIALPRGWPLWRTSALMAAFILLANLPDCDPLWPMPRYGPPHTFTLNLALTSVALGLVASWPRLRRAIGGWRGAWLAAAAWASHLVLDAFYWNSRGPRIGWPLPHDWRLHLPIPLFVTMDLPPRWTWHNVRVMLTELAVYGVLLAAAVVVRRHLAASHGRMDGRRPPSRLRAS